MDEMDETDETDETDGEEPCAVSRDCQLPPQIQLQSDQAKRWIVGAETTTDRFMRRTGGVEKEAR